MILKNAMIHVGDGTVRQGDIRIRAGKIAEVGNNLEGTDVRDLTVLWMQATFLERRIWHFMHMTGMKIHLR